MKKLNKEEIEFYLKKEQKKKFFKKGKKHGIYYFGKKNGKTLQYPCLEDPMDRRASWAAVHAVTKSQALND